MSRPVLWSSLTLLFLLPAARLPAAEIHEAAKRGDLAAVRTLLAADPALLEARDEVGYPPLNWAAIRGQWAVVRELVARGADVNAAGGDGGTPLHCAANVDDAGIIDLLLERGAALEARNAWGNTPLQMAVQRGALANVRALAAHGADLATASDEGWTPLHYATKCGHEEVRRFLLEAGASPTAVDRWGRRPADYAFVKPPAVDLPAGALSDYAGDYVLGGGFVLKVWLEDGRLMLEDFAHDELYPIAWDRFYSRQHPWTATFYRDPRGRVDKLALAFQRQTVVGRRATGGGAPTAPPRLGVRPRELADDDLTQEQLARLLLVEKAGPWVQVLEIVQEGSAAARAGLLAGDVLLEFDQQPLLQPGDLPRLLLETTPGQEVPVRVFRQGRALRLTIRLD